MLFNIISIICIFALICLFAVLIESRRENHMLSVSHYTITDKRIKKSATFAMIADLHNAEFGDKNEELIKEIKKIAPDAVLIAGDVIVGKKDVGSGVAIDLLQKLGRRIHCITRTRLPTTYSPLRRSVYIKRPRIRHTSTGSRRT